MVTERLYYDNAYLRRFQAQVVDRAEIDGFPAVALDQTGFYPTGGGQPCDAGTLNRVPVRDVRSGADLVWHVLEQPLDSDTVEGVVDWQRRWDHMQNHSGQHVLSQSFVLTSRAMTIAWHMSESTLTIDLDRAGLSDDELAAAESLGNEIVQQNRPIKARILTEIERSSVTLRKQPDVDGPLRIVTIEDFDQVACSGTHVSGTAEIGLVKVLRAERRGQETRIHFVCGQRALADYARKHRVVRGLAARFTCSEEELPAAVHRLQTEAQSSFKSLKMAQQALVEAEATRLWAQVEMQPAPRVIAGAYPSWDEEQVKALVVLLRRLPGCFIAVAGGQAALVFAARSKDGTLDAGQALRAALSQVGGRGGGGPDYAQGSAPNWEAAKQALALIAAQAPTVET